MVRTFASAPDTTGTAAWRTPLQRLNGNIIPNGFRFDAVGSFWPYAKTLFDYARRAMPVDAAKSLSNDDVYSACGYALELNGIIDQSAVMSAQTLAEAQMPNHGEFLRFSPRQ